MDHQQRRQLQALQLAHQRRRLRRALLAAHGGQRRGRRTRCPRHHARMHGHRLKAAGVAAGQQARHAGAGRQAGHGHPLAVGCMAQDHLVHHGHQRGRFGQRLARAQIEPVPAALGIGQPVLLGVEHQAAFARRQVVHARALGKVAPALAAAVQHHQQRQSFSALQHQPGGPEQVVAARPGRADGGAGQPVASAGAGGRLVLVDHGALHLGGHLAAAAQGGLGKGSEVALGSAREGGCEAGGGRASGHGTGNRSIRKNTVQLRRSGGPGGRRRP